MILPRPTQLAVGLAMLLCGWPADAAPPQPAAGPATEEPLPLRASGPDGRQVPLPAPPPDIASLIRRGNVAFTLYDPRRDPQEFTGLTHFDLRYRYKTASRWTVRRLAEGRQLQIRPRLRELELDFSHQVVLPERVQGKAFFDHPLVLHELDHVRISTDPRLESQFRQWIQQELRQLTVPLQPGQQVDDRFVRQQVDQAIEAVFQRLIDLARIRYQELDRETDHGQRPLPDGFLERLQAAEPAAASP